MLQKFKVTSCAFILCLFGSQNIIQASETVNIDQDMSIGAGNNWTTGDKGVDCKITDDDNIYFSGQPQIVSNRNPNLTEWTMGSPNCNKLISIAAEQFREVCEHGHEYGVYVKGNNLNLKNADGTYDEDKLASVALEECTDIVDYVTLDIYDPDADPAYNGYESLREHNACVDLLNKPEEVQKNFREKKLHRCVMAFEAGVAGLPNDNEVFYTLHDDAETYNNGDLKGDHKYSLTPKK